MWIDTSSGFAPHHRDGFQFYNYTIYQISRKAYVRGSTGFYPQLISTINPWSWPLVTFTRSLHRLVQNNSQTPRFSVHLPSWSEEEIDGHKSNTVYPRLTTFVRWLNRAQNVWKRHVCSMAEKIASDHDETSTKVYCIQTNRIHK